MIARAVAITSALLISPIVSKKEMSTECPNWVQFSATEIGAARRFKKKNTHRQRETKRKIPKYNCTKSLHSE